MLNKEEFITNVVNYIRTNRGDNTDEYEIRKFIKENDDWLMHFYNKCINDTPIHQDYWISTFAANVELMI